MMDVSRRRFLKGVLAAAAIPIVAPILPVASSPPSEIPHGLPLFDGGDLWIRSVQFPRWRFVGMAINVELRTELMDDTPPGAEFGTYLRGPRFGTTDIATDVDGQRLIVGPMTMLTRVELAYGGPDWVLHLPAVSVIGFHQETGLGGMISKIDLAIYEPDILRASSPEQREMRRAGKSIAIYSV